MRERRYRGAMRRCLICALTALVIVTAAAGCAGTAPPADHAMSPMSAPVATTSAASTLLEPAAFAAAIDEPGRVVIDVHIPFEGRISPTDLEIPYDAIAAHVAELPTDRITPLAIYCRSGSMSAAAAPELAALGFTDIVELRGGMDAWVADGRTLLLTH